MLCAFQLAGQQDVVSTARKLAQHGQRTQAKELLRKELADSPSDSDARILYGAILSWDGAYPEARVELERVLLENPRNSDALQALANVELWTDHPDRAEDLLRPLLRDRPSDTDLLYSHAKSLIALKDSRGASTVLQRIVEIDPGNAAARSLREGLGDAARVWESSLQQNYEWFSDGIGNRVESQMSLKGHTSRGSVIGRFSNAERFGLVSNQVEADFYPGLRKGTYAYLSAGFSPDHQLYPQYRVGSDIFQSLGHGFEGTAGYRHLSFSTGVNIFTTALSKYYGPWLFTGRGFFTPDFVGTSQSFQLAARRFFRDSTTYWQFRFGHGLSPTEIRSILDVSILKSNSYNGTLHMLAGKRWLLDAEFGVSREDRLNRPVVNHFTANAGAGLRF